MNAASLTLVLALLAGVLMAVQAPTNALLGKASGSPVVAAFISFVVGTVALGALVAATSGRLFAPDLRTVPWYAWLGGFYGASSSRSQPLALRRSGSGHCLRLRLAAS